MVFPLGFFVDAFLSMYDSFVDGLREIAVTYDDATCDLGGSVAISCFSFLSSTKQPFLPQEN